MTILEFRYKFKIYAYPDEEIQAFEDWFYYNPGWAYKIIQVMIIIGVLAVMVIAIYLILDKISECLKKGGRREPRKKR